MWFLVFVPAPYSHWRLKYGSISTCMAADTVTNSEDKVSSKSGRVAVEGSTAMMTMVQSVSKCEGKVDCSLVSSYHDVKPLKILKPAERTKFQRICKEKSRKSRDCSKVEGVPPSDCKSPSQCFGTEERKAEADTLHRSPMNDTNSGNTREGSPLPNGPPPESIPSISNSEYHVLAVDDSNFDRRVVERFLKASSYKVTTVNSALRALEVLGLSETCSASPEPNKLPVDLIITDYCMPGMTGYELLKIVKSDTSVCKEIPVIVMSSEGDSNRINRCLAEGAGAYIIKPVKMEDVKRLRGHIRSSASSSESCESSNSSIGTKRKSPDSVQLHSPEKRPRTAESLVS